MVLEKFNSLQLLKDDDLFSNDPEEAEDNLGYVEDYIMEYIQNYLIEEIGIKAEDVDDIDICVDIPYHYEEIPFFTVNLNIQRFFGDKENENVEKMASISEPMQIQIQNKNWKKALNELDDLVKKFEDQIKTIFTSKSTDWKTI